MANFVSEDQIEKAIIEVFVNTLGYRHFNCVDVDHIGRENGNEVVLKALSRKKLEALKKELLSTAIDEVMEQRLDRTEISTNREIYNIIRNDADYKQQRWQAGKGIEQILYTYLPDSAYI